MSAQHSSHLVESSPNDAQLNPADILYKEGSVICSITPYVWTILPGCVHLYCYRCGLNPQPAKAKRCSGCQYVHYCSKECQTLDWKDRHKIECKIVSHKLITGQPKFLRDTTIMMFAAIARLAKEMASGNENSLFLHLPVNLEKALIDMVNPRGALIQHKELFDLCDPEKLVIKDQGILGMRNFAFVFGAVMQNRQPLVGEIVNSFAGGRMLTFVVGTMLNVTPVPIERSCIANAIYRSDLQEHGPSAATIRAVKDIRHGEPITMTREYRFATLKSRTVAYATEGVVCSCKACTDPAFQAEQCALKCATVQCEEPIPADYRANLACSSCGTINHQRLKEGKAVTDDISKWLDVPEGTIPHHEGVSIPTKYLPNPDLIRAQLQRAVEVLHPTNLTLGKALLDYTDWLLYCKKDDSPLYLPYLQRIIPSIELHLNKYDQRTRQVYMDIVRAHIKRKEYKEAQPYIDIYLERAKFYDAGKDTHFKLALLLSAELRKARPSSDKLRVYADQFDLNRSCKSYQIKFHKSDNHN